MTKSPSPSVDEVAERREALLSILRNAVIETAQRVSGRRGPYVFDEAELQGLASEIAATAASLVSPPKAEVGEPAYWHNGAGQVMKHAAREALWGTSDEDLIGRFDEPLYANHEARGDGVRVTDAAANVLIGGHERACVRWAMAMTPEDASRIWAEQVKPTQDAIRSALLPPLGGGLS